MAPKAPAEREEIVDPHSGGELPARDPVSLVDREGERERPDEVRRDGQQDAPLAQRLGDEPDLAVLQIAEAAVDQPARPRAGSGREVAPLDQPDPQPAHRRIARHAGADDPAPDDEQVERLVGQAREQARREAGSSLRGRLRRSTCGHSAASSTVFVGSL